MCFVAEYVIDLHKQHPQVEEFRQALVENGADFTDAFVESLHRHIMKPADASHDEGRQHPGPDDYGHEKGMFPALEIANAPRRVPTMRAIEEEERERRSHPPPSVGAP